MSGLPVHPVVNHDWKEGMGASLRTGVAETLRLQPGISGVIVALADQPDLDARHLTRILTEQRHSGRSIVAWQSGGVPMPPVYFGAGHFSHLLALPGDAGARQLLRTAGSDLAVVVGESLPDLDTQSDYEKFLKRR